MKINQVMFFIAGVIWVITTGIHLYNQNIFVVIPAGTSAMLSFYIASIDG